MRESVISIGIYPSSECEKLNVRSFTLVFASKIATLRISDFNNVMVPNVNKFNFITKY
jgi:hypothetical protein